MFLLEQLILIPLKLEAVKSSEIQAYSYEGIRKTAFRLAERTLKTHRGKMFCVLN
jgi:hypothetical protein